jgi:hypothetical protein
MRSGVTELGRKLPVRSGAGGTRERTFVDREIRTTTVDPEADDRVTAAWCHNLTFGCELLSPIDPKSVGEPTSCAFTA